MFYVMYNHVLCNVHLKAGSFPCLKSCFMYLRVWAGSMEDCNRFLSKYVEAKELGYNIICALCKVDIKSALGAPIISTFWKYHIDTNICTISFHHFILISNICMHFIYFHHLDIQIYFIYFHHIDIQHMHFIYFPSYSYPIYAHSYINFALVNCYNRL